MKESRSHQQIRSRGRVNSNHTGHSNETRAPDPRRLSAAISEKLVEYDAPSVALPKSSARTAVQWRASDSWRHMRLRRSVESGSRRFFRPFERSPRARIRGLGSLSGLGHCSLPSCRQTAHRNAHLQYQGQSCFQCSCTS